MDRISYFELDWAPDPNTDPSFLPLHLRGAGNSQRKKLYIYALPVAIDRYLSESQKEAINMRFWQMKSTESIALETGVNPSAIRKRIQSALKTLEDRLEFCAKVFEEIKSDDT